MTWLMDPEFWARLLGIILIDISLAGDNALVIALAVRGLCATPAAPRPDLGHGGRGGPARGLHRDRELPAEHSASPAPRRPRPDMDRHQAGQARPEASTADRGRAPSLREAIWIIIVADVTMSLDNVLGVAAAAKGDMVLVVLGIALSLPLVVWGSGLLATLMARFEWIVWLGAACSATWRAR